MNKLAILMPLLALVLAIGYVELRLPAETPGTQVQTAPDEEVLARLETMERLLRELNVPPPISRAPGFADARAAPAQPPETSPARPGPVAEAPVEAGARNAAIEETLALLKSGRADEEAVNRLWEMLPGSGLEDAALAAFQAYLKDHPNDPDAQYGVGVAAISKLVGGDLNYMEQGKYSGLAEKAFTRALELDDQHFSARFSQAISYTHWPDAFGKGPAAIREFEVLRERHRGDTSIPEMEEVYRNLGVQYRKLGQHEEAKKALEEGLAAFPESAAILEQLESMEK